MKPAIIAKAAYTCRYARFSTECINDGECVTPWSLSGPLFFTYPTTMRQTINYETDFKIAHSTCKVT